MEDIKDTNIEEEKAGSDPVNSVEPEAEKKYTDADVDKIVAKRIARERERTKKILLQDEQISELEKRERDVTIREMKATAAETLRKSGLPSQLANLLDYSGDTEQMIDSLNLIQDDFLEAVEMAVRDRVRGKTPPGSCGSVNPDQALRDAFMNR